MAGVRIREDKGFYLVEAGGRTYRLPKQYVELAGDTVLVSRKTGYRFHSRKRRPTHPAPTQATGKAQGRHGLSPAAATVVILTVAFALMIAVAGYLAGWWGRVIVVDYYNTSNGCTVEMEIRAPGEPPLFQVLIYNDEALLLKYNTTRGERHLYTTGQPCPSWLPRATIRPIYGDP